jgi:hypothetical protein
MTLTSRVIEKSSWWVRMNNPSRKTVEEITREAEEEIAWVARPTKTGKWHNCLQDDLESSVDEPRDGAPSRRHHTNFNPQRPIDRDRL